MPVLEEFVAAHADSTKLGLAEVKEAKTGIAVSPSTSSRALAFSAGLERGASSLQLTPRMSATCERAGIAGQPKARPARLVFFDESGSTVPLSNRRT